MNTLTCVLTLILSCGSKPAAALTLAHAGTALADTWSTQRALDRGGRELNPLTRPFQTHGQPLAYASTAAGVVGTAWLADRMRRSKNWTRKIWWLPQAALAGVGGWAIHGNLRETSAIKLGGQLHNPLVRPSEPQR